MNSGSLGYEADFQALSGDGSIRIAVVSTTRFDDLPGMDGRAVPARDREYMPSRDVPVRRRGTRQCVIDRRRLDGPDRPSAYIVNPSS